MKEFIIISGTQNSGKTTTAWCVYQRLLPYSSDMKMWICGDPVDNHGEIVYKQPEKYNHLPDDFKTILEIYDYKVAIISGGDYPDLLEKEIEDVLKQGADFIVISLRSVNRPGSSRNMIQTKYPDANTKEYWLDDNSYTNLPKNLLDIANSKRPTADRIANYILLQTNYPYFK